jgi:hypothetical protein
MPVPVVRFGHDTQFPSAGPTPPSGPIQPGTGRHSG